jgi:hypothetical protein
MASALQCPACGHKHRLTELSGDPVFACEQCGRLLKTPLEYRRPEPSAPSAGPPSNGAKRVPRGSAARDQTAVVRPTRAPAASPVAPAAAAAATPRSTRRSGPRPPSSMAMPLQILAWVVAVILGGIIIRYLGKATGLVTGDSVIDILTGTGWGRYLRVFALVPFWALATAGLMTGFVEGMRVWGERRRSMPSGRPAPSRAAAPSAAAAGAATSTKRAPTPKPAPAPKPPPAPKAKRPAPKSPSPSPTRTRTQAPAPAPAPAPVDNGAATTDAPRPRRIPKRGDITS